MPTGRRGQKHWAHVTRHLLLDCLVVVIGLLVATSIRAGGWDGGKSFDYAPAILIAALVVGGCSYISGLYSLHHTSRDLFMRLVIVSGVLVAGLIAILVYGSVDYSARIGRGVLLLSMPLVGGLLIAHHLYLLRISRRYIERLACLASDPLHEREAELFESVGQNHTEFVGIVEVGDYSLERRSDLLGKLTDITRIIGEKEIDCLLCPPGILEEPDAAKTIRELRYSGVTVLTLADICEEFFQAMPLELATPEWLLGSSGQSRLFYVRQLKRAFDIGCALFFLMLLSPFLLLGMLAVRLTSRGGIFYRQNRAGRFGRKIEVIKLRTMRVDAEKDGPRWSSAKDDRVTLVGGILRKFRIDEIPQLWNVLKGQMSFVGPRPERPEFIGELAKDIPLFSERVMVQPGLTGWAQVNYPYGASADDARRKLEYDLYYMKHMSIFLDCFIILDTVRIVFLGGAPKKPGKMLVKFSQAIQKSLDDEQAAGSGELVSANSDA